jgi:hypothetical protein
MLNLHGSELPVSVSPAVAQHACISSSCSRRFMLKGARLPYLSLVSVVLSMALSLALAGMCCLCTGSRHLLPVQQVLVEWGGLCLDWL